MSNQRNPSLLVVGVDEAIRGEFHDAISQFKSEGPSLRFAFDRRQALEIARTWRPDLICVEMHETANEMARFARELRAVSPKTVITAIYEPSSIEGGDESNALIACVRAGVQDFFRRPVSATDLERILSDLGGGVSGLSPSGHVVSFISNKGGAGKSTLAVNVACDLARQGKRTLLIDASVQMGTCASMLDLEPKPSLLDLAQELDRLDETLLRELVTKHPESGLDVIAAPTSPASAAEIKEDDLAAVISIARRAYDVVVVDTFPLIDGLVLAILDASDLIYVVLQCAIPHVKGARGLLDLLDRLRYSEGQRRIILNDTHGRHAGSLRPEDVERWLGKRSIDHKIPFSKNVLVAMNSGRPAVLARSVRFGFGKAVRRLSQRVMSALPIAAEEGAPPHQEGATGRLEIEE